MKAETQANSLASLVQKKKKYPEYELSLKPFKVKQSTLKKLAIGDVLLVGLPYLEFILLSESKMCANILMIIEENTQKFKITNLYEETYEQTHTKKYEIVKCSFGRLQSRKLEVGYKVSVAQLNLKELKLFIDGKKLADAKLVKVDDEIAIEITKVKYV